MAKKISKNKKVVVKSLIDSGMTYRQVNEVTGVSLGYIKKIIQDFEGNREFIEWYQKNKADVLIKAQLDSLALQEAIRDSLTEDDIKKWTPDQKARWYQALTVDHGVKFDKERLVSGESTENVHVIVGAIKALKRKNREQRMRELGDGQE